MTFSLPNLPNIWSQPVQSPESHATAASSSVQSNSSSSAQPSSPGVLSGAINAGRAAAWRSFAGTPEKALESSNGVKGYLSWHGLQENLVEPALRSSDGVKNYIEGGANPDMLARAALASHDKITTYLKGVGDNQHLCAAALESEAGVKSYLVGGGNPAMLAQLALNDGDKMKAYLAAGGDIGRPDEKGESLFRLAAQQSNDAVLKEMARDALTSPAKMKTYLEVAGDNTHLCEAALESDAAMTTYLAGGGNIRRLDEKGKNLFHLAAQKSDAQVLEVMSQHMNSTMSHAERSDIVNACAIPAAMSNTPLTLATMLGRAEVVKVLLDPQKFPDIDPNKKNSEFSPLDLAVMVAKARAEDWNESEGRATLNPALDNLAALLSHPDVPLEAKKAAVNTELRTGFPPLIAADDIHNQEAFQAFLKVPGVNVKVKDLKGLNILARVADGGTADNMKALLNHPDVDKAMINEKNFQGNGNTPLHIAASANNPGALEVLALDERLDSTEVRNSHGDTAAMGAAACGSLPVLQKMVELNKAGKTQFNLNARNERNGLTVAHGIVKTGTPEAIEFLMKNGVDFNVGDKHNITPHHHSALYGNWPVFDWMRKDERVKFDRDEMLRCAVMIKMAHEMGIKQPIENVNEAIKRLSNYSYEEYSVRVKVLFSAKTNGF